MGKNTGEQPGWRQLAEDGLPLGRPMKGSNTVAIGVAGMARMPDSGGLWTAENMVD